MSLNGIITTLLAESDLIAKGSDSVKSLNPSGITVRQGARPAYLAAIYKNSKLPMLVLTPRPEDARRLQDQLLTYMGDTAPIYIFPSSDVLPFERLAVDTNTGHE